MSLTNACQFRLVADAHFSGNPDNRNHAMAYQTPTGGNFAAGNTITGGTSGATAKVVFVEGAAYSVRYTQPSAPFRPGETISNGSGVSAVIEPATLAPISALVSAGAGIYSDTSGRSASTVVDQRYRFPDVDEILAMGFSGTKSTNWAAGTAWNVYPASDYYAFPYAGFQLPHTTGSIGHVIAANSGGVTLIGVRKSAFDTGAVSNWACTATIKTAVAGDTICTVEWKQAAAGCTLKNAAGDTVSTVIAGTCSTTNSWLWIRIDWRTSTLAVLALAGPTGPDFATTFAVSSEFDFSGVGTPGYITLTNPSGSVACNLAEFYAYDDPWCIIGDSLTEQMQHDVFGPLLSEVLSSDNAAIDLSAGSAGLIFSVIKSFATLASTGKMDVFRFPAICCATLGINDWNAGNTLAAMQTAFADMLADLDQGADHSSSGRLKKVVWCQTPPGALAQATNAAKLKAFNSWVIGAIAGYGERPVSPDLYSTLVENDAAANVVLARRLRRTTDGTWSAPRGAHVAGSSANIHLSRAGVLQSVWTIDRAIMQSDTVPPVTEVRLGVDRGDGVTGTFAPYPVVS